MRLCRSGMAPAALAGRVFRIAVVGVLALVFGALTAAFVVAEEQCDGKGGGAFCARSPPAAPLVPPVTASVAATLDTGAAALVEAEGGIASGSKLPSASAPSLNESPVANTSGQAASEEASSVPAPELGVVKLGFAFCMLFSIMAWLVLMLKFAVDGSLPARLALWGLLPEAYAAISVRAVYHLLRLKTGATPVVILRNCVTDENARKLAEGMDEFGDNADLQALELPHNPMLGIPGLQVIADSVFREASKIVELDFSYNPQLGDRAVSVLRPALEGKKSKIQVLRLADCGLTKVGLQQIADGASKSKLRTLDLSWNPMKGQGELVGTITEAPILEELVLTCCDLDPNDVAILAEQLPFTSIRSLQLGGNRFGSPGLERLCEHLANCQIDELGLEGVGLEAGCEGLSQLAAAWVKRPFSRLRLYGNRMSNEEIATFVKTLKSMQT